MQHPVLSNKRILVLYYVLWVLIIAGNSLILKNYLNYEVLPAIIESTVSFILFSLFGLGLWYMVRYTNVSGGAQWDQWMTHFGAMVLGILTWLGLQCVILTNLGPYSGFFKETFLSALPIKISTGVLFWILITLVFYVFSYHDKLHDKLLMEAKLKENIQQAELERIKSQINPHFLFNSLNSINALVLIQPLQARDMIVKLSDYLRKSLQVKADQIHSFQEELSNLLNYFSIEKIRYGERLEINTEISKPCFEAQLPSMILQPLMENAIKYGVESAINTASIALYAKMRNNELVVIMENSIEENNMRKGTGKGLNLIRERLQWVYGELDLLQIIKKENTFTVELRIPQQVPEKHLVAS